MRSSIEKVFEQGSPCYIIAEIGINHNGDLDLAKKLIDVASVSGCDCVKFQKRDPEICVPKDQRDVLRDTPWGRMTYLDYKKRIEFGSDEYDEIDDYCTIKDIDWTASPWDIPSVDFLIDYDVPFIKIPSAKVLDKPYLKKVKSTNKPLVVSTGMTTLEMVKDMWYHIGSDRIAILHTVSSYPAKNEDINLKCLQTLHKHFKCPVGYSGHEKGIQISLAAVAMGARIIERHITLDRSMWGTDQSASLEPEGIARLVRDVRIVESSIGDGVKRFLDCEKPVARKLRQ